MKNKVVAGNGGYCLNAPINAEEIYHELQKLGSFSPQDVLKKASTPASPLYKYFEWDDSKAAHEYRLGQARSLVISIQIETEYGPVRAFNNLVINSVNQYVPLEDIKNSSLLQEQVIQAASRELNYWKEKYRTYENYFGPVFEAIKKIEIKGAANGKKESSRSTGSGNKNKRSANSKEKSNDNYRR